MGGRGALPVELLGDSEAALRRAADLLAHLGVDGHADVAADCDDTAPLLDLSEELRLLRAQIDECAAEVAWSLHEAGTLVQNLEKRLARIAAAAGRAAALAPHPD